MKTKVLAIMLSLCMALGVCTSVVQAGPIVQSGVSVLYMNQVSEEEEPYVTTERTEYTKMIAVCGDEGSEYTLTEDVSDVVFLVNNTMVTLGEGGGYAMAGLLGTASLTDGNLVLTPPYGTPAFTGDPTVFEEWATFFENEVENAFIPLATYNGDLAQDHQFPYSNLTVHGNLTVSGDWMYQENLTVDGNLTVQTIFSVENAAVSGNIFIQAPEGGDPNGLNILWGGSLTLGGTFTADDGQIFELVDNAAVYGDVPLYVFDGEGLVPFVLESEHKLLDFTYVAAESAFVKQENGGGDDDGELREFDARLDYDHSRALITVLIDGAEPFTVYGGERFFFTYDDQPHPLCFSIDTARNAWGELEEEEQIHDLSVSVFYYYKGANDDIWMMDCIVRAGEATDERFTFENNTLSFTPASTAPFYMEICLTEEEYAFATMSPEEGEVLLEYYIEGFGGVTEGAAKHRVHAFGNTKMIFDLTDRATVFTNITPQEGESLIGFRFQYEYFFLDNEADMARLAENGAVYDAEAGTLTVTFDPEEPYMDLVFWFSGGDPGPGGDLNDFDARVNYDDNRVAIVAQIGETDPFDVRSWDRFLFAPEGELQPVSLTIDTTRSIWRELSEEERVQDMSVFIVCRWRDHEDRNVWHEAYIVRAGVVEEAYRAQYTFENNELSFLPETGEPFELEVYLNESELVFNQIQPDEGEVLIQYDSNGRGSFSVSGYKDAAYMGGMTKMIFDAANETILFTEINPAEGEELIGVRFMDEEYRFDNPGDLARLAGCGVTYDAEAHTLTVTMNPEQPYLYLTIRFSDYGSSWLGTGQFALQYRYGFGRVLFARDAEELLPIPAGPAIDYAAESTLRFELDYRYDPNGYPIEKDSNCYIADEDISPWILLRDEWTHQEMWIVETGVVPEHLQAQFTFEDNTLIFQTENAHPFTLSVFWTDEDKAYSDIAPQDGERSAHYFIFGDGNVQVIGALREGRFAQEGRAILPHEAQEVSYRFMPAEGGELSAIYYDGSFISLTDANAAKRLAEAGIRIEGDVIIVPIWENESDVQIFFTSPWNGDDVFMISYDSHDFQTVVDINGEGALVDGYVELHYPKDEFTIRMSISRLTDRELRGIAVYDKSGRITYIPAEEMEWDGSAYSYGWSDRAIFFVCAIGYGEPFENEYKIEYNEGYGTVTYNDEAIRSGRILSYGEVGDTISLSLQSNGGQPPYRIFAEWNNKGDDVTACWQDGVFRYEPVSNEAMRLKIYWTEEEFEYDNFWENWDETLVELTAQGRGHIEVADENGEPLENVRMVVLGGNVKLILPRDAEKTLRVVFVPDEGETVDRVETAEGFLNEEAFAGNTILWTPDTAMNRAWMQVFFSDSSMAPCPHDEGTHLQGQHDATCTSDGYTGDVVCNRCGEVFEYGTVIPATGHTPSDWQFDEHDHWKNCLTENAPIPETFAEHSESRWIVDSAPDGETPGHRHTVCTVCGCTLRDEDYTEAKGDVNGDGAATDKDRMILSRYLAGWDMTEYGVDASDIEKTMDINGDGRVTAVDRAILARYLAGWGNEYTRYF